FHSGKQWRVTQADNVLPIGCFRLTTRRQLTPRKRARQVLARALQAARPAWPIRPVLGLPRLQAAGLVRLGGDVARPEWSLAGRVRPSMATLHVAHDVVPSVECALQ